MKGFSAIAAIGFLALGTVGAQADAVDCTHHPQQTGDALTILFDAFIATPFQTPATCIVPVASSALAPGEFSAFKVDYRGALSTDATGNIVVSTGSHSTSVTLQTGPDVPIDGYLFTDYFAGHGTAFDSSTTLALVDSPGDGELVLDTIDFLEVRTNSDAVQTSADQLAADRTSAVTHLNATADLLSGAGQTLEGTDSMGGVGGVGSATVGVTGRKSLGSGFSLLGGAAFVDQTAGGAKASGLVFSGTARYVTPGDALLRPFGEVGLHAAPALSLSFTRQYATNGGMATATGNGSGSFYGGYLKGGVLVAPDPSNDIVFAATLGKDWLSTGAYTETMSGSNLFAASAAAQTGSFDTVKLGAEWTTRMVPQLEVTVSGAVGRTIAENSVSSDVAFAGSFTGAARSENFVEYGLRAGHDIVEGTNVGVFVHGATGDYSGTHLQVGGDLHVRF